MLAQGNHVNVYEIEYKNLSSVCGWDRKICLEDHCLAS